MADLAGTGIATATASSTRCAAIGGAREQSE
jgi:hypothetical protein